MTETRVATLDLLAREAIALATDDTRAILGITGSPGAGKSTLVDLLLAHIRTAMGDEWVAHIPMDGFHLADAQLDRMGARDRKGAPDTFDAAGYVHLLRRLRAHEDEVVYAPEFRREIEEPIACAVPVPPRIPLVVTEGNYLLLADPPWHRIRPLLDEVWFLAPQEEQRRQWLIDRHRAHGRTLEQARERTFGSDEANAVRVNASGHAADLVLRNIP
jgi:pantothenate kinase